MKVFGAEVARVTRSAAARGEVADFERARNGWRDVSISMDVVREAGCIQGDRTSKAFKALVCSMAPRSGRFFLFVLLYR